ncbi:MYCBP-associated protein [Cheilinus undulatus]|uniref:MYCBP-associated protein n=1 Tax=Cheilinus undulatus TaxID=241271 RepID=UPI001BD22706|nr:MYCBP-associated protein [Cheilinus undulatus]
MASEQEVKPDDEEKEIALGAHQANPGPKPHVPGYPWLQLNDQGMILPHCILGNMENFRIYCEAKGETELLKRIPVSQRDPGRPHTKTVKKDSVNPSGYRNIQSNALQNWNTHMTQRRQQQDFLSDLLNRPVENLLMNQADHFRETQERRELLNQGTPLPHRGYGYRVGSEFWTLPQRYGDDMSGISATLTQTELGRREPVTHVGQPSSIRKESGLPCDKTLRPSSRTWDQSSYLQQRCQELGEVLQDTDMKKPDISKLEVIGSCKPLTHVTECSSPSIEKEANENGTKKKENLDPLAQYDDVHSDALPGPALRFCGLLARWTGNSPIKQGEVGISETILFEALTGERAFTHLELHNVGSTAIFYSWQQLPIPRYFPHLIKQRKGPHFYFNSSSGVILPGDTKKVEFIFKSAKPGIINELWQFRTHPLLLEGASIQVTLTGMALNRDTTAEKRRFLEERLEKKVTIRMCQSIIDEIMQGISSPERPSSPAELYFTEEQKFLSKNPKLQFLDDTVEDLNKLWQEVNPGQTWDLSVDTLRQAVLAHPDLVKNLDQFNSLVLQLCEPSVPKYKSSSAAAVGRQLWRKLLDRTDDEAGRLRNLLCLPPNDTWSQETEESLTSNTDMADNKDETDENKERAAAKEERSWMRSEVKNDSKRESEPATMEKVEDSRKKKTRRDEVKKRSREKPEKELPMTESVIQQPPEDAEQNEGPKIMEIYTRLLHRKVYALIEELIDNLCAEIDEQNALTCRH